MGRGVSDDDWPSTNKDDVLPFRNADIRAALTAENGTQHLGKISNSLERIARALEKMAARLP